MYTRRRIAALLVAISTSVPVGLWSCATFAQAYPTKPIKLINPFPAGGSADMVSRSVARKMSEGLRQQVIVDNRVGAGGRIGLEAAAKAPEDGYTIVLGSLGALVMTPIVFSKLPYDTVKSFAPISLLTSAPFVITVNASVPANTLKELIDLAKAKPGQINYSSIGYGSLPHFAGESFKTLAGVDMVHVPYKGSAPELVDLLGGQVQVGFNMLASFQLQNYQSGKLRALAVAGPARITQLPSVPTAAEAGLRDYDVSTWFGLLAPAGTPAEIIKRLNEEAHKALAAKDVRDTILAQGLESRANSPEEFSALISNEVAKWTRVMRVMKGSGFKVD